MSDPVVALLAGVGDVDVDVLAEHWTEDFILELPYADPPFLLQGKDAVRAYLREALETFTFRLQVTDVYECPDRGAVIAEYVSEGTVSTTGKAYRNQYVGVFMLRGDKVCHQREFYNPLPAIRALS